MNSLYADLIEVNLLIEHVRKNTFERLYGTPEFYLLTKAEIMAETALTKIKAKLESEEKTND